MHQEIILAGFGGQGVLLAGELLAYAGMRSGRQVTWVPSYGPEMRGGTANCAVVVSDHPIGSPVVTEADAVVALNLPSMEKFAQLLKPQGVIIVNSSLIQRAVDRTDISVVEVPCNAIAEELGSAKVANMVALGALLRATEAVTLTDIVDALAEVLPERRHNLIPMNKLALERGFSFSVS